ncbi:MAG: hypothetical protein Q4C96_07745 [Planctomycetia bacterium]|nr:hypothetical protein [Planctomycetia bacterium]
MNSPFEIGMLICFGASWPISIWKLWRTKNSTGVSLRFLSLVEIGYICGMLHKIFYNMDAVFWLYALNFIFIIFAMILCKYYRVRKILPKI